MASDAAELVQARGGELLRCRRRARRHCGGSHRDAGQRRADVTVTLLVTESPAGSVIGRRENVRAGRRRR